MAKLSYKVSYYIMYICFAADSWSCWECSILVGYNNPVGEI